MGGGGGGAGVSNDWCLKRQEILGMQTENHTVKPTKHSSYGYKKIDNVIES